METKFGSIISKFEHIPVNVLLKDDRILAELLKRNAPNDIDMPKQPDRKEVLRRFGLAFE